MKNSYGLSKYEQETIVLFNDEEADAIVYTASPLWIRRLDKLVSENPAAYKCIETDDVSKTYTMPKKLVHFRVRQITRSYTEQQREESRQRLLAIRQKQNTAQIEHN